MAKLKKREIIILVIAALFVLYAGYVYLIAGPAGKKVKPASDTVKINDFTSELSNDLGKDKLTDFDEYVIKRTQTDWAKNPFWKKDLYRAWAAREGADGGGATSPKIIYSGYVDSGGNKMAVLNGLEYRAGEKLEMEGYILKQITPSKVLIFDKRTGNNLEIPIQE
ncbi:MAG: hypothetical protein NTW65_06100 [Deltaproteobacteria bacterium]|nr:hypothetical protein [Deltaproteobacteria bacterium]